MDETKRTLDSLVQHDCQNVIVSLAAKPGKFGETVHNAGFQHLGLPYRYVPLWCDDIARDIALMRKHSIRGAGITMPHKQAVMPLLDVISDEARVIGAVNTVVNDDGVLVGHNTDLRGVRAALVGTTTRDHFVILGRGGMAKTFQYALADYKVTIISRENWDWVVADATVLINATPMGMSGYTFGINLDQFPNLNLYIESVVGETPVKSEAQHRGIRTFSGIDISFNQAFDQFEYYTNLPAPEREMKIAFLGP